MRCCSFFGSSTIAATGVATGVGAAGGAVGAAILQAAGWTIDGVTVASITTASAVGTAAVAGGVLCCLGGLVTVLLSRGNDNGFCQNIRNAGISGALVGAKVGLVCLPVSVLAGSAMLGQKTGEAFGFAAASGGVGLGVLGGAVAVSAIVIVCTGVNCYLIREALRETTRHRRHGMQANDSHAPYAPSSSTLTAVKVTLDAQGRITDIHPETELTVKDSNGKPVTGEAFVQLVAAANQTIEQAPAPAQRMI